MPANDERPIALHLGQGWMVADHNGITRDPNRALLFETPEAANRYAVENGFTKAALSRLMPRNDFNV